MSQAGAAPGLVLAAGRLSGSTQDLGGGAGGEPSQRLRPPCRIRRPAGASWPLAMPIGNKSQGPWRAQSVEHVT